MYIRQHSYVMYYTIFICFSALFLPSVADGRALDSEREIDLIANELDKKDLNKDDNSDPNVIDERRAANEETPLAAAQASNNDGNDGGAQVTLPAVAFYAVVAGCSVAGFVGLVVAGVCWYKLQKNVKAASEAEYPAYGVTGPNKERLGSPGDRKLAQSAQMYHYQHQKQQMIALEKANGEMKNDGSDEDSEEENEEGDYTVYECPGLAPTGEMEVKNPLFSEETPVTPTPGDEQPPTQK